MTHPRVVNVRAFAVGAHRGHRPPLPDDVVYVGRPSRWGNAWPIGTKCSVVHAHSITHAPDLVLDRASAIGHFRFYFGLYAQRHPDYYLEPLKGKRLACYCAPLACHAEVIMEYLEQWEGQHGEG